MLAGITTPTGKIFLNMLHFDLWEEPLMYFFWGLTGFAIVGNFTNLNAALALFNQLTVSPIVESCYIFGTMAGGLLIMEEIQFYEVSQICLILMGSFVCVLGIMYKLCMGAGKEESQSSSKVGFEEVVEQLIILEA